MQNFDYQLVRYKELLKCEIKLKESQVHSVASILSSEIDEIKDSIHNDLKIKSPISFKTRAEELIAFQNAMEIFNQIKPKPEIIRTQVVSENYFCFVYLKDTLFEILKKQSANGSVTKKCVKYLLNNPVRAFRNAIAHGNWKYKNDFSGIEFWARKGSNLNEDLSYFFVSQFDLGFWKILSKVIAYIIIIKFNEK